MRLPDGARSQAVLIGASRFTDPAMPDLPAVRNNVTALAEVLTSPSGTGLPAGHCAVFSDPSDVEAMGIQLESIAEQARDVLLVYYAGHGLVDAKGRLCLALPGTVHKRLRWTALEFARLRDVLADSPAENRVLILDCCFSGRAIEAMGDPASVVSGQIEIAGTYTLASAPANAAANAPEGATYTAFTGELLAVLREGLAGGPELLSFNAIYPHLLRILNSRGLSHPVQRGVRTADQLALAPNHAYRKHDDEPGDDPLTGLLNRAGFVRVARARARDRLDFAVLRIDLDVFSMANEALGLVWADRMAIAVSWRIRDALGPDVPLARLEGTSFAALLVGYTGTEIHKPIERLRDELSGQYALGQLSVNGTPTIGYAIPVDGAEGIDALLQRSDIAVRAATAGDAIRDYQPGMRDVRLRRFQLTTQFRQAYEEGQLSVHYQPRISLAGDHVTGVEALARWRHPELGQISPDEFVPVIEAEGLIGLLTDYVMEQALTWVRKRLDEQLRMSCSVNVSVRSLADPDFPDQVAATLRRTGVPAELLKLELMETAVMAEPEKSLPVLRKLRALGIVLTLDDFGTGYSSLAGLRALPVDELNIDLSFVLGMGTDLSDLAVVRSIVDLGHSLGLSVLAEGVEEQAALDQLTAMGCDYAQGYLISRPLSEDSLEEWLHTNTTRVTDPKTGEVELRRRRL